MTPDDLTRRDLLMASALMLGACAKSSTGAPRRSAARRIRARPQAIASATAGPTLQPEPLGLAKDRDGVFYVPASYDGSAGVPLLLFMHGANGAGIYALERLIEEANRTGAIIVAPDSRRSTWGMISGDEEDDIAFIDSALAKIFAAYRVDPRRIGIGGFSDGASAALSLGLVNGDFFSSIIAFSPGFIRLSSDPKGSPRVFISHGKEDDILPIERCGRRIARELLEAGYRVKYYEFDGGHTVPSEIRRAGVEFLTKS